MVSGFTSRKLQAVLGNRAAGEITEALGGVEEVEEEVPQEPEPDEGESSGEEGEAEGEESQPESEQQSEEGADADESPTLESLDAPGLSHLAEADIKTVRDYKRFVEVNGTIEEVNGIGPKTAEEIEKVIEKFEKGD